MMAHEAIQRIINGASPTGLVGAGAGATVGLVIALVLLAATRWKRTSLAVVALALATILGVLAVVQLQTVTVRESESVTVIRSRFSERIRTHTLNAMIGIPVVVAVVAATVWAVARGRRRMRVPHLLKAGRAHLFQKEYDSALARFHEAIRIAPHRAEAYLGRGNVRHALGDHANAVADFDQAILRDPRLVPAYIQRAKIRIETGDLDGALDDFAKVLNLRATDPEVYLNRGICLLKKGQPQDAAVDFHRVLKLTNHSDFAEPAKEYLHQIEYHPEPGPHLPEPGGNGELESPAVPRPQAGTSPPLMGGDARRAEGG